MYQSNTLQFECLGGIYRDFSIQFALYDISFWEYTNTICNFNMKFTKPATCNIIYCPVNVFNIQIQKFQFI